MNPAHNDPAAATERLLERAGGDLRRKSSESTEVFARDFGKRLAEERASVSSAEVQRRARRSRYRTAAPLLAAASILVLIAVAFLLDAPSRLLDRRPGVISWSDGSGPAPGRLEQGRNLVIPPASHAALSLDNGRAIVFLEEGELWCDVESKSGLFQVHTPKGSVTVLGTAFGVEVGAGDLEVTVERGTVRIDAGGGLLEVTAGASAHAGEGVAPHLVGTSGATRPAWVVQAHSAALRDAAAARYPSGSPGR